VVGSGAIYHATKGSRMGTVPSYCSKGYPCFRVLTVYYIDRMYFYLFTSTPQKGRMKMDMGRKCVLKSFYS
jgi:hypothetical protein